MLFQDLRNAAISASTAPAAAMTAMMVPPRRGSSGTASSTAATMSETASDSHTAMRCPRRLLRSMAFRSSEETRSSSCPRVA